MTRGVARAEVTRFLDAWFGVRQVIQAANFNRFQGAGLSATQFMALNLLPVGDEGIAIGELARRMNLKPATVAKTVDSLEAREMIARGRSDSDGRVVIVSITAKGRELQNAAKGEFREHMTALFAGMLPEERSGLIAGLESLVRAAHSGPPHAGVTREADADPQATRNIRRPPKR